MMPQPRTVSPLGHDSSDEGTWQQFAEMLRDEDLPLKFTVDHFAELFSPKRASAYLQRAKEEGYVKSDDRLPGCQHRPLNLWTRTDKPIKTYREVMDERRAAMDALIGKLLVTYLTGAAIAEKVARECGVTSKTADQYVWRVLKEAGCHDRIAYMARYIKKLEGRA